MKKITQLVSGMTVVFIAVCGFVVACSSNPEAPSAEQAATQSVPPAPIAEGKQFPPEPTDPDAPTESPTEDASVAAAPEAPAVTPTPVIPPEKDAAAPPPLPPPAPVAAPKSTARSTLKGGPKTIPGVLEEVTETEALGTTGAQAGSLAGTPEYEKLKKKLAELGYEGVGLEHEPATVLNLLYSVFSSPDAAKRKIKRVYTGGSMEYDATAQAVTIGGLKTKPKILNFFRKRIPKR